MILALETGWTPAEITSLPSRFRAACHWVLYARVLIGPEGLPSTDIPTHLPYAQRLEMQKQIVPALKLRAFLFPEDTDGDA